MGQLETVLTEFEPVLYSHVFKTRKSLTPARKMLENVPKGVFPCEESIAHIPEAWKRFPDPDSRKKLGFWCENYLFSYLLRNAKKDTFLFKSHFPPKSGSGKRFQSSGMRAIDSPHKITPIEVIFRKINFRISKKCTFLGHPRV